MAVVRCPSCRSLDVVVDAEVGACAACGARFSLSASAPTRGRRPLFLLLGVIVVAVAGVMTMRQLSGRSTSAAGGPAAVTADAAKGEAKAEVQHVREGNTLVGGRYWLMSYVNTGGASIDKPSILVRLVGADGAVLREEKVWVARERIGPGESMPAMLLVDDPPPGSRAEITPGPITPSEGDPWKVPLTVEGLAHKALPLGATMVVGEVINPHPHRARFVEVVVVGLDGQGHPVSWGTGLRGGGELEGEARSPFQVRLGAFEVETPVRYEAWAQGNLIKADATP